MRKNLMIMLLMVCALYSCQKNGDVVQPDTPDNPVDTNSYPVTFNVQTFGVSYENMEAGKINGNYQYFNRIYYKVYDSLGNFVKEKVQNDSTLASFGIINDTLQTGKYNIVVLAATSADSISIFEDADKFSFLRIQYIGSYQEYPDMFLSKSQINVSKDNSIAINIRPERITGKLEIILEDTFPTDVLFFNAIIDSVPQFIRVCNGQLGPLGSLYFFNWKQIVNYNPINIFCLGSNIPHTISIRARNTRNNLFYEKTIEDVYIYPNKKTILRGRLTPEESAAGFSITVDTSFDETIEKNF